MNDLTLDAIKLIAQTLDYTPGLQAAGAKTAITQLLRQLDEAKIQVCTEKQKVTKLEKIIEDLYYQQQMSY